MVLDKRWTDERDAGLLGTSRFVSAFVYLITKNIVAQKMRTGFRFGGKTHSKKTPQNFADDRNDDWVTRRKHMREFMPSIMDDKVNAQNIEKRRDTRKRTNGN